jgi:two-component system sensor histidine kinase/response regulator
MDVMMPEMDGLTATRAIRKRQNDPAANPNFAGRILIVRHDRACAWQSDKENCLASGMDDYLAKPIRPADVRGIIEKWAAAAPAAEKKSATAPKIEASAAPAEEPPVDMAG